MEPLWSIGVEEVFYLWLAPVLKFFHKHILVILGSVIVIKIVLLTLLQYIETPPVVSGVTGALQFEAMATGGLVAYFVFHRKKEIASNILFSKPVQMIIFALLFLRLCCCHFLTVHSVVFRFLFFTPVFSNILFILLFAWLIVNISLNRKKLISLENQFLNFGGGISYGIYMWHMLVIFGMVLLCKNRFNNMNNTVSSIVFYVVLTVCVLAVSYLSKRFFEDKFLRLKNRYY